MHKWSGSSGTPIRKTFGICSQNLHDLRGLQQPISPSLEASCSQGAGPLETPSEISGYVASALVLLTFIAKDMRQLRTAAIFSNLAFITYGTLEWLPPVFLLHLVLLPLNIVRLNEIVRATRRATGDPTAQTLGTDMIPRGQQPVAAWPTFLSMPKIARPA